LEPRFAATAFATAFTIVDPIAMIPATLATTAHLTPEKRRLIVDRAAIVAALVALFMGVAGNALLRYLGVTLAAFTIAGGVLLFLISVDMVFGRPIGAKATPSEEREASASENPAVFPLAIPMLVGPGTMATIILLMNLAHGDRVSYAIVFASFGLAIFSAWLCMRASEYLGRLLGKTAIHVITRLLGIILAGLAVQFVLNGLVRAEVVR
jgi:multiple antibiotic resistance protein